MEKSQQYCRPIGPCAGTTFGNGTEEHPTVVQQRRAVPTTCTKRKPRKIAKHLINPPDSLLVD